MSDDRPKPRKISTVTFAWLIATLVFASLAFLVYFVPPGQPAGSAMPRPGFDLQGHRGARGLFPENSLPGFRGALAIGVATLEMDLGMTRDGVLVVHHDLRLNPQRTRGPDGVWLEAPGPALSALSLAELRRYDVGRPRPGGEAARRWPAQAALDGVAVPTLAEVFALGEARSGGSVRYNLEAKLSPLAPKESPEAVPFADELVAVIREAGVAARAGVQSFDWRTLQRVQDSAPEIPTAYLTAERRWLDNLERGRPGASPWTAGFDLDDYGGSVPRLVKAAGGAVWSPYFRDLRLADLREAHRLGLPVVVWTVNEADDMAALIDMGVQGIVTDYPDRLRRVLADKGHALPRAFPADE